MSAANSKSSAGAAFGPTRGSDAPQEAGDFQRRYQLLTTVAPVGIYHTTADGQCVYVNERWCELTGVSSEEARGEGWARALHPEDRAAVFEEWSRAVQERRLFMMEYRYQRPDGRVVWVLGQAVAERDATDTVVGYVGAVTDITERKRAEQVTATFAELGRQLGAVSSRREAALVVLAAIDRLFAFDAMLLHMLSEDRRQVFRVLTVDTLHGRRVEQIAEEVAAGPSAMFQRVASEGAQLVLRDSPVPKDVPLEPFGDAARPSASLMFVPVRAGERVIGVLSVQSYTPRAYDAGSLERLQSLADYAGTGLARVSAHDESDRLSRLLLETQRVARLGCFEGNLVTGVDHWSDEAYRQMGYAPGEVPASLPNFLARLHPEDRERVARSIEQLVWDGRSFESEYRLVSPDGTVRHINSAVSAETNAAGRVVRIYGAAHDITRQKQIESELRSTQAELEGRVQARTADLQAMFNALPDLIFRLRTDGVILDFKAEKSSILYVAPEKFLGRRMQDVLPPEVGRQFDEAIRQAAGQAAGASLEYKLPLADGLREFEARIVPASTGQLLLIVRDITERKDTEAALRESQARLSTVIDSTPDWIFIKDQQHRYQMANAGYAKAFRLRPEDFIGKNDLELGLPVELVKGDPAKGIRGFWADDREVMDTGQMKVIPEEPGMAAGEPVFLSTVKVPLRDASGKVTGVLGYVRDITERKTMEGELRHREEQLRDLFENATDLIQSVAPDGRILFVNRAWLNTLGYGIREIAALTVFDILHPDCLAEWRRHFMSVQQGALLNNVQAVFRAKDGRSIHVEGNVSCRFEKGMPVSTRAIFRDITERKLVEAERERLIRQLQDALAEVKTLSGLLPICGWCKKIRDDTGYWNSLEGYLKRHHEVNFTHGICPECSARMMVELDKVTGTPPDAPPTGPA